MADPFLSQTVARPNVPTTPLEQLQLATEAKAARIAAGQEPALLSASPVTRALVATDPVMGAGSLYDTQGNGTPSSAFTGGWGSGKGMTVYASGKNYGYNVATGNYEVKQPGQAYEASPLSPREQQALLSYASGKTSPAANAAANLAATKANPFVPLRGFGSAFRGGWGSNAFTMLPNGMPIDSSVPLNAARYPASIRGAPVAAVPPQAQIAAALLASRPGPMAGVAAAAPGTYNPTVDVTGVKDQHNAGGWGINAGGGIVP